MQLNPIPLSTEEQLRLPAQLLNTVEQAILTVDLTGHICYWNRSAETFYGWTAQEVKGRRIEDVFETPLLLEAILAHLGQMQRGEPWSGEFLLPRRNGTTCMVHASLSLIQIEQRTLISFIGRAGDNTEYQRLQQANRLLAEADALLTDEVDYEAPLNTLAQLAVPQMADWCAIHLLQPGASLERVVLAPAGQANLPEAADWLQGYLLKDATDGLPAVLHNGKPKLVSDVASDSRVAATAIKSYMIVPLIAHPKTFGAVTFVAAESGRRFDVNALALAENLVSHIATYLDKARLYRESQRLYADLEQRVGERTVELRQAVTQVKQSEAMIQTLFRISNKLNATLDVDTILDALAQEAIQIVSGESGFAGLRTSDGMTVHKYFRQGQAIAFEYTWPVGQGIPGWVLKYKVPYGTSDAAHDPLMLHELEVNLEVRSIICTPILDSVGDVLGYFDIRNKLDGEGFTISDQELLMALAPVASIAIQNALAYQQRISAVARLKESSSQLQALAANLEAAREEERKRIARELHDQLGQALTAMKFDMAWLTDRLWQKDAILAQKAKTVTTQMDSMIKTVRRIATDLRPGMLDDLGLGASIEWLASDFEKRTGIVCEVSVPADDLAGDRTQSLALFRICQETLTNVARHAGAQHVEVKLTATPEVLTLQVHDDGRGIQAQEISGRQSLGLLGMQERANRLGGTFDIQGVPADGTIVTVSIPVKQGN